MTGIIDKRLKGLIGVALLVLMGLQLYLSREEEMVMKLAILIIIAALGFVIPLFWLIGTATGFTYFGLHRVVKTCKEQTAVFNPQLGLTMADGGDPIDKEKKE
jgi:4-amino-4-deoxy-L-arabinose transferase-like glycosyltransferase